jgi:hypothetical protein
MAVNRQTEKFYSSKHLNFQLDYLQLSNKITWQYTFVFTKDPTVNILQQKDNINPLPSQLTPSDNNTI